MADLEHFELGQDFAAFRPAGEVSRDAAARLVTEAIAQALEHRIPKLLVDLRGLSGFPAPGLGARYHIVREWATASRGFVALAVVIPKELADPEGFGLTVARNMGMVVNRFDDPQAAEHWLRSLTVT